MSSGRFQGKTKSKSRPHICLVLKYLPGRKDGSRSPANPAEGFVDVRSRANAAAQRIPGSPNPGADSTDVRSQQPLPAYLT